MFDFDLDGSSDMSAILDAMAEQGTENAVFANNLAEGMSPIDAQLNASINAPLVHALRF